MTKDEFNKLDIIRQIDYLNTQLKKGTSLTILCKNIGIARSTVGGRVKKQGYVFDKEINQYTLEKSIGDGRAYSKLTVSDSRTMEDTGLMLSSTDSSNLGYLLKNIDILKNFIEGSKISDSPSEVNSLEDVINDIYKFKQDKRNYKVKSLRIDADILNDFESIANDLSSKSINQQEFLNYILKSYIEFYKSL
ncbi:MAG: hypothetical protein ACRCYC_05340 [Paraclostridium sp.]|uniref:hypothetical protein n=1 Tax=Paraclostridium sp. TaxID=2023273 RepID=UPI003F2AFF6C